MEGVSELGDENVARGRADLVQFLERPACWRLNQANPDRVRTVRAGEISHGIDDNGILRRRHEIEDPVFRFSQLG